VLQALKGIQEYSRQFNNEFVFGETTNNVGGSALGSWINLTLVGEALKDKFTPKEKENLEKVLGVSISDAYFYVKLLAEREPEIVSLAIAFWTDAGTLNDSVFNLIRETVGNVTNSEVSLSIPPQSEMNRWAENKSKGLIKEFPISVEDEEAILANLIATKVQWYEPYNLIPSKEVSHWGQEHLLYQAYADVKVYLTANSEPYLVHKKTSAYKDGRLAVYSIIGEKDKDLSELYSEFLLHLEKGFEVDQGVRLAEDNFSCDFISFKTIEVTNPTIPDFYYDVTLPAWSSEDIHDIEEAGYESIISALKRENLEVKNYQAIVSSYNKNGYEAAALTIMSMRAGAVRPLPKQTKEVTAGNAVFNHSYLSVSVFEPAVQDFNHPWNSIPLFVNVINKADTPNFD
jgi:hypothetical protein